ncbi:MAG: hypothetical protein ABSC06_14380 [Rhodopila sp.]|jgi:hypothetical protein
MSDETADLTWITEQQRQILTKLSSVRDDIAALTAIALRQDGTLTAVLGEIRAMHAQHSRLADRVRDLDVQP